MSNSCAVLIRVALVCAFSLLDFAETSTADDWPQWRGVNRDGVWHETGLIESFDSEQIPIKWSVDVEAGYSGPTVAGGRVYVTDRIAEPNQTERIHCFSESDGERVWTH
ncbi:MAG: PQQ-binding-like beta-propeller repeat protein, partial [Planctomycetales bacterium]|nr:PQQ-binding-like beta-propeller repeat protein [Planctomycetales bacterium]